MQKTAKDGRKEEYKTGDVFALRVQVGSLANLECREDTDDKEREVLAVIKQGSSGTRNVAVVATDIENESSPEVYRDNDNLEQDERQREQFCGEGDLLL